MAMSQNHLLMPCPAAWTEWAEACLCLGHGFLSPRHPRFRRGLRDELTADLRDLNRQMSFASEDALGRFESALRDLDPDSDALLRIYSQLFLAPPAPASLNAGMYLDGGIMGNSVLEMEEMYERYALARDAEFRDLPDHLALQLQFLGYLMACSSESDTPDEALKDAHGFIRNHLLTWLPVLIRQCRCAEARYALPPVYSSLVAVTIGALDSLHRVLPEPAAGDIETPPRDIPDNPAPKPAADSGDAATCGRCSRPFMAGSELAAMITALQSHGLDASHLAVCADCRTSAMGLQPLTPPRAKKPGRE